MAAVRLTFAVAAALIPGIGSPPGLAEPSPLVGRPPPEWQTPGPPRDHGFGATVPGADPYNLILHNRQAQEALAVTPEQIQRLGRAERDFRAELQEEVPSIQPAAPPPEGNGPGAAAQRKLERHMEKTKQVVAQVLTPEQLRRLQGIMLQITGPCMLAGDRRLSDQLELGGEQLAQITGLCRQMGEQIRGAAQRNPGAEAGDRCAQLQARRQEIDQIRNGTTERIFGIFSAAQRAVYSELAGPTFVLDPAQGPPCGDAATGAGGPRPPG